MKTIKYKLLFPLFVTSLGLLASTAQGRYIGPWSAPIWEGIQYAEGNDSYSNPSRLQKVFAIRVSLKNPDVGIFSTPSNGSLPYETTRQTTKDFVNNYGSGGGTVKCAINSSYFDTSLSPNTDMMGVYVANGTLLSTWNSGWLELFLLGTDKSVWTQYFQGNPDPVVYPNGMAGDVRMLINGVPNDGYKHELDPRTAIGVSADGKYLIMVVIDGRQPGWSDGAYWSELGQWCLDFGAWNAVNLDGGGSSQMVITYGNGGVYKNQPSETYRAVGANLGITSQPCNTTGPGASWMNANRLDLVVRGNLNTVQLKTWTSSGDWGELVDLSGNGSTYDTPGIVSRADGMQDVFIRGTDGALWQTHLQNNTWSSWTNLGGAMLSGPAACSQNSNNITVCVRGINDDVNIKTWTSGSGWSGWTAISGVTSTYDTPAICSRANGVLDVFIRGAADNCLWHRASTNSVWGTWENFGGYVTSGISACSRNVNNITVMHRGDNYDIKYAAWNSGTWSSGSMGPSSASLPGLTALKSADRVDFFIRGLDDGLWQNVYQGGVWTGYINLGPYF
jgi:phosphodiester glycosidase